MPNDNSWDESLAVAIVGMAGRFPCADDPEELWNLVSLAQSGIQSFTREELVAEGLERELVDDADYVRRRGVVAGAELFDAEFFGYSPREAEQIDPQQRIFLEVAWHALEDASCDPAAFGGQIGVFAGLGFNTYLINNLLYPHNTGRRRLELATLIGSDKDFLATRISYKLGLTGPSMTLQTACSTSLATVALACASLLNHQSDLALAGGVSVGSPRKQGYLYEAGGILSPDGRCLPFDARSAGTVPAEGAGIVVLKRLQDALADGDAVRAVILGSAVNNDGTNKAGFTAPSVTGQARVIREALGVAAVSARSIGYVETHGTGTALGDPLEFEALCQAFRVETSEQGFCALGALKANVGHLDTAAGVAGLIKAVLALQRGQLPPLRGFQTPNPRIDLDSSPFYVPTQLTPWPRGQTPRRAGVSAFGIGGTNVHVVLQEAPAVPAPLERSDAPAILALSARSSQELHALRMQWAQTAQRSDVTLQSLARATQTGRKPMRQRRAWVVESLAELQHVLSSDAQDGFVVEDRAPSVAFVFPGQGSAYPGMGRELWDVEPVYRKALQTCFEQAPPIASRRLADWFQQGGAGFERTDVGQPLLFAVEYALAQLWLSRGLEPVAMVGHSLGEYVAACLADVLSLQDALKLIEARGRLAQQTASGAMLAVAATDTSVRELLDASLSIAAYNTPNRVVVSGSAAQIEAFEQHAQERAWLVQRLNTSHAFHSAQVEPMLQTFRDVVSEVQLRAPQRRYVSNVSGNWAGIEVTQPQYWVEQLRQPVQFSRAVSHVGQQLAPTVWVELGPGPTLGPLVRGNLRSAVTVSTLSAGRERRATAAAHAALWTQGVNLRWPKLHHPLPSAPLPRYPFRRITHWIRPQRRAEGRTWLRVPRWTKSAMAPRAAEGPDAWLVLSCPAVADALEQAGRLVVRSEWTRLRSGFDHPNVESGREYGVVVAPPLHPRACVASGLEVATTLASAVLHARVRPAAVAVLLRGAYSVDDGEALDLGAAGSAGALRVFGQELLSAPCRIIDVDSNPAELSPLDSQQIVRELLSGADSESTVCLRSGERHTLCFTASPPESERLPLRTRGSYLVTGGGGRIGSQLSRYLAEQLDAHVFVLNRRTVAPPVTAAGRIDAISGDVCDRTVLQRVVQQIVRSNGRLDGVIHAAGNLIPSPLSALPDPVELERSTNAKVEGALALREVLQDVDLDFVVLASSLSAFLGGPGHAAYAAACSILNGLAFSERQRGARWLAINWDAWLFGELPERDYGLALDEGLTSFVNALRCIDTCSQILVGSGDLDSRADRWFRGTRLRTTSAKAMTRAASASEAATPLAEIWCELLGVADRPELHDDFLRLGGDSLIATKLSARISQEFGVRVSLAELLADTSLDAMTRALERVIRVTRGGDQRGAAP